jgi:Tfp pilus assembly protein PilF/uncharacterized caspase-like protein
MSIQNILITQKNRQLPLITYLSAMKKIYLQYISHSNIYFSFWFSMLLVFILTASAFKVVAQTKGVSIAKVEDALISGRVKALVVGLSDYKELPDHLQLRYAHADAKRFMNFLKRKAPATKAENFKLLLNEQATAGNIYSQLDWLLGSAEKDELVIIYFSGHGDVETKTIRERGFLLAYDTPVAGYHAGGTIRVSDLQDYVATLSTNGAKVLVITDACRSGKLAGGNAGLFAATAELEKLQKSTIKIMSSQAGELSWEDEKWDGGAGIFTFFLINGLEGKADFDNDGLIRRDEVEIYLKLNIPKETQRKQNPVVEGGDANQVLFSVSKEIELLAKADVSKNSKAKGNLSLLNTEKKTNLLLDFQDAIEKQNLITPKYTSAIAFYNKAKTTENNDVLNYMRITLVAALVDESQSAINLYMKGFNKTFTENIYLDAANKLKTALALMSPDNIRYNAYKARLLFLEAYAIYHTGDYNKWPIGIHKLNESVNLDADAAYVYHSLGQFFYTQKQPDIDNAIRNFRKASELAPTWTYPLASIAAYQVQRNNLDSAQFYYLKAINFNPKVAVFHNNLGAVYTKKGKLNEALQHLDMAISLDSLLDDAYVNKATLLMTSNKLNNTLEVLEVAISKRAYMPKSKGMLINLYTILADAKLKNKEYDIAVALINRRISLENPTSENLLQLSEAYLLQSDLEKASQVLQHAISLEPQNNRTYYQLARVFAKAESPTKCAHALQMAYRFGNKDYSLKHVEFDKVRDLKEVQEVVRLYKK